MIRRFAYIVGQTAPSGISSLYRLDISKRLFYPSPAAAADAANKMKSGKKIPTLRRLPPAVMRIRPSPTGSDLTANLELLALLSPRRSEDMIICGDSGGRTVVCNTDSHSTSTFPYYNGSKGFMPVTFSIARPDAPLDDLYVLGSKSFDVLSFSSSTWRWEALPPPPFAGGPWSHTVVDDGKTICVSAFLSCGTTFCFDTVKREWWRPASDWAPPFVGNAEYLPDLKVWLGLSSHSYKLCAWDLSDMDQPPVLLSGGGEADVKTPEDWVVYNSGLLSLGAHRFCVVKVFHTGGEFSDDGLMDVKYGVLTGVEVVPGSGNTKIERIIRHKSVVHPFLASKFDWVL